MVTRDDYVHLHTHSHYSLLDGLGKPSEYARRAAEFGQPALGITDHGSLSGAYEHWKECNSYGIKPIIGVELYVAPEQRTVRAPIYWGTADQRREDVSGAGAYTHLTVVATGAEGLRNLYRLQSRAYSEGFYRKPRVDLSSLEENHRGLICLTGCPSGAVSTLLRLEQADRAREVAGTLNEIFRGSVWLETMTHGSAWEAEIVAKQLEEIHKPLRMPLVVTNDAHYVMEKDADVHSALLCVQTGSRLSNPTFSFDGSSYYLKSRAEMATLGLPVEGLQSTLDIAERISSYDEVFEHRLRMPSLDGELDPQKLEEECFLSHDVRWPFTDEYRKRMSYELDTIISMGYAGYFRVLARLIRRAKDEGIRIGPGRGSAGGSLVAYALDITALDPISHGLLFERFLNPSRVSLPDIDIDVDESQRPRFLELVREEFGEEYVAQINTVGTIGAKAALKDANRVMGGSFKDGEALTRRLPAAKFGRPATLADYEGPETDVVTLARGLEGTIRNEGIHAAKVVISPEVLSESMPLRRPKGTEPFVTGFTMEEVASLGFVGYDLLGLRNLGVIDDCLHMLGPQETPILPTLPRECNDPATYRLLSSGETTGVFQLDSPGMRGLLRSLRPNSFGDISGVLALYRPGPMDANAHTEYAKRKRARGWDSNWAIHPEMEMVLRPVLEETFGLIVYQEQVLQSLNAVCGWSYAEAGLLFDAMRKKNHEKMAETKPAFFESGRQKGFSDEALTALWETLVPFADYSFGKAHSAGYGLLAYWTAYLKANHTKEYMAALLSSVADDKDRLPVYLEEVRRLRIPILPPDINDSGLGFSPVSEGIRYGLGSIKGVGKNAYKALLSKRPYTSFDDFLKRTPNSVLNSGTISVLIRSGSFDKMCPLREELDVARETLVARATTYRAEKRNGSVPLYPVFFGVGTSGLYNESVRREWEMETLSVVLTERHQFIKPTRTLTYEDVQWLKEQVARAPGTTTLTVTFGSASVKLGMVDWDQLEPILRKTGLWLNTD